MDGVFIPYFQFSCSAREFLFLKTVHADFPAGCLLWLWLILNRSVIACRARDLWARMTGGLQGGQECRLHSLWSARQFLQSFVWAATAGESTAIPGRVARPTGQTCRVKWTTKKWKPIIFPSCFSNCRGLLTYHLETMLLAQTERELSPSCPLQLCLGDAIKC